MQKVSGSEIRDRVTETAELLGLGELLHRGASQLSGGQMQRVALARSIAMKPKILLLDEPLSNLDAKLRERLRFDLKELQTRLGITSVYVTHDQSEALALADRIAVMRAGDVVQLDDPVSLYKTPNSKFVADFLGVSNILPGTRDVQAGDTPAFSIDGTGVTLKTDQDDIPDEHGFICLRPETIRLSAPGASPVDSVNRWTGEIATRSFLGTHTRYRVTSADGLTIDAVLGDGEVDFARGDTVELSVAPADVRVLGA